MTLIALAPSASAADGRHKPRPPAGEWELVSNGLLTRTGHLNDVSAAGPRDAWAVGQDSDDAGYSQARLLHWDGEQWSVVDTPGLPELATWYSVDALSPSNVWIYGWDWYDGEEVVARYDGRDWEQVGPPEDGADGGRLTAVPGRTWLAEDRHISTYARGEWETTAMEHGVTIREIDATSRHSAWAVGGFSLVGQEARPVVMHWDGRDWEEVATPYTDMYLRDVYAESRRSVYAVGTRIGGDAYEPVLLHFNGRTWRDITGPVTGIHPEAVNGDGRGGLWFTGNPEGWEGPPVYWHYDDRNWTRTEGPTVPGPTQSPVINDLAPIGRTGAVWAVGDYQLLTTPGNARDLEMVQRYDPRRR